MPGFVVVGNAAVCANPHCSVSVLVDGPDGIVGQRESIEFVEDVGPATGGVMARQSVGASCPYAPLVVEEICGDTVAVGSHSIPTPFRSADGIVGLYK